MKKRTFLSGAAVAAANVGFGAGAAPTPTRIRYGGDAGFPPFESLDDRGVSTGFQVDLLAELGPAIGVDFAITLQGWAQTEAHFREGRFDVIAMVDTEARRRWANFTHGHATPAFAVYHRRGRPETQGLQDLVGLRIAVLDSEVMGDTLKTWFTSVPGPFLRLASASEALAAVEQGRADVALLPRAYADPVIAGGNASNVITNRLNLPLQTYAFAVAPGEDSLRARLQQGLDLLESDGRLEALRTKWLSSHRDVAERVLAERDLARHRDWSWGLAVASTTAVLLMGAGVWHRGRRLANERHRRIEAEAALKRSEDLLERTFARHPDPMLIVDRDSGVVSDANAAMLWLLGARADGLIGRSIGGLGKHVDADALQGLVRSLRSDGALDAAPLRLHRADGAARECLVSADLLRIDAAVHVLCIIRDITEQLAHDAALRSGYDTLATQLEKSRDELDTARAGQTRAERALQDFTRSVAHDLKAPLNAVQGFAGLLRDRLLAGHVQEALGCTEHIDRAALRMSKMIGALSSLAQVGKHELHRQVVDMTRLAQETWSLLSASHRARQIDFRMAELPGAHADPDLAAQVWQNLLDNALKYSAGNSEARVSVDSYRDDRGTWFRVADNGVGFDSARAELLFQPFQRMHSSKQFEGTGVGLSLVRRIIDHHRGDIRLRSAVGVGTVAEFTLDAESASPLDR